MQFVSEKVQQSPRPKRHSNQTFSLNGLDSYFRILKKRCKSVIPKSQVTSNYVNYFGMIEYTTDVALQFHLSKFAISFRNAKSLRQVPKYVVSIENFWGQSC